jgi:hypothetical protein
MSDDERKKFLIGMVTDRNRHTSCYSLRAHHIGGDSLTDVGMR